MLALSQLRDLIERTLKALDMYSEDAANLVLGTILVESKAIYLRQLRGGPALGIIQMEPQTFEDIIENYLDYDPPLKEKVIEIANITRLEPQALEYNLVLCIIFCRLHYKRHYIKLYFLPDTLEEYAKDWKYYYNTHLGAGTEARFIEVYEKYLM